MDFVDIAKAIRAGKPDMAMPFQVKPYDIDVAGIVHNSVYHCWLDDLRCEFLTRVLSVEDQVELGFIPVLARTDISYKRPIKFGDKISAELRLTNLGKIKWRIDCIFFVGSTVVTEAMQEGCVVDLQSHRPIPMPDSFQSYWQTKLDLLSGNANATSSSFQNVESFVDSSVDSSVDMFSDQAVVCPV
ncbi:MAG: thioesterase family protein [Candidatus Obscuribacterales bacterium]|nr:thioesterase family protein [Candidatus Obscuribacterales bacterium]